MSIVDLKDLVARVVEIESERFADVVILILPSTDETKDLIGSRQLGLMKQALSPHALIVNTEALMEALHAGRIHGNRCHRS